MSEQDLLDFLDKNNYTIINTIKSLPFGDFCCVYSNGKFLVRYGSDRTIKYLDFGSVIDRDEFFDMALIKTYVTQEKDLDKKETFDDVILFFIENNKSIEELFVDNTYSEIKQALRQLNRIRLDQKLFGSLAK